MTIWSPEVDEWKKIISAGGSLLRATYAVTAWIAREPSRENLLSVFFRILVREKIEVKVELMVAHMLIVVTLPDFADSKAIIIVAGSPEGTFGAHNVFPLLAIIWSKILVAMLCRFFLRRVPSVVIWQMIWLLRRARILIFLYCAFSWLGRMMRQILQLYLSMAFFIIDSIIDRAFLGSNSPAFSLTDSIFTRKFREVLSKVSRRGRVSCPAK